MRKLRVPAGCRPLTALELKRVSLENRRALFPSVLVQRLVATIEALQNGRTQVEQQRAPMEKER